MSADFHTPEHLRTLGFRIRNASVGLSSSRMTGEKSSRFLHRAQFVTFI